MNKRDLIAGLLLFCTLITQILDLLNGTIELTSVIGAPLFISLILLIASVYFFWSSRNLRKIQKKSIIKLMQLKPELKVIEHRAKWQFNVTNCLEREIEIQPIEISFQYEQLNKINGFLDSSNNVPHPPIVEKSKAHKLKIGESVLIEVPIKLPFNYSLYQIRIESFEANIKCGKEIISLADSFPKDVQIKE